MTTPSGRPRMGEEREALARISTLINDCMEQPTTQDEVMDTAKAIFSLVRSAPGWIACSERMPGHSVTVQTWRETYQHACQGFRSPRTGMFCDAESMGELPLHVQPSHWMPLPSPPANKAREEGRTE